MNEVIARWEAFLSNVRARFEQIMEESRQGCAALFEQSGGDPIPLSNAWAGMNARALTLGSKVTDTFEASVDPALEAAGASVDIIDRERERGLALVSWMDRERERVRVEIFAGVGRRMWEEGLAEQQGSFACSQCGAGLRVPRTVRAVNLTCPHCSAVVTFEPGMRLRYAANYVHNLVEQDVWPLWLAWQDAEDALRAARGASLAQIQAVEDAQIAYWRAYLEARARWLPERAADLEADLRGKMRQWYDTIQHERAWVQAGRPRKLPFA